MSQKWELVISSLVQLKKTQKVHVILAGQFTSSGKIFFYIKHQ